LVDAWETRMDLINSVLYWVDARGIYLVDAWETWRDSIDSVLYWVSK
jgi:hypothetical protein